MVWVEKDLKDHLIPSPCLGADTFHWSRWSKRSTGASPEDKAEFREGCGVHSEALDGVLGGETSSGYRETAPRDPC